MDTPLVTGETITYKKIMEAAKSLSTHLPRIDWDEHNRLQMEMRQHMSIPLSNLRPSDKYHISATECRTSMYNGTGIPNLVLYDDIIRHSDPQKLEDMFEARRLMQELYATHPEIFKTQPVDLTKSKPLIY